MTKPEYFFIAYYRKIAAVAASSMENIVKETRIKEGSLPGEVIKEFENFWQRVIDAKSNSPKDPASALNAYQIAEGVWSQVALEKEEKNLNDFHRFQEKFAEFNSFWEKITVHRFLSGREVEIANDLKDFFILLQQKAEV